jgi:hypothetical protein
LHRQHNENRIYDSSMYSIAIKYYQHRANLIAQ